MKASSVFQSVKALLAPSDEQLMWRVQTCDDAAAFGELVARWQVPIRRLAARMTGDAHRAEDLAQEVFTRLFQHRMSFRLECKVSTYLWRIAINRCYSETKFVAARREIPFEAPADGEGISQNEPAATERSPDEQVVASETAKEQAGRVQRDTLQQLRQAIAAQRAMSLAQADGGRYGTTGSGAGGGGGIGGYGFGNSAGGIGSYGFGYGGGVGVSTAPVARPSIVTTDPLPAAASANLSEDLTIMHQILAKAVRKVSGPDSPGNVLGINIWTSRKDSPPASLYLEGYGVLFQFQVDFPLLPPPTKAESKSQKSLQDTTWESTRQELFGQSRGGATTGTGRADIVPMDQVSPNQPKEPRYIRDRVEALQAVVLGALKEASHIRHLKPDQNIVVVVRGGPTAAFTEAIAKSPNKHHMDVRMMIRYGLIKGVHIAPDGEIVGNTNGRSESVQHALSPHTAPRIPTISTLTISVTKADADAFAKGSLKFDQFRKKAKIALY